jgi:hypothetical protein
VPFADADAVFPLFEEERFDTFHVLSFASAVQSALVHFDDPFP